MELFRIWMLALPVVLATNSAHGQLHKWVDDQGVVHFSDTVPTAARNHSDIQRKLIQQQTAAENETTQISGVVVHQGITAENWQRIQMLLKARQFTALNGMFDALDVRLHQHPEVDYLEAEYHAAFDISSNIVSPGMDHYFTDWATNYPGTKYPFLAKATFYLSEARLQFGIDDQQADDLILKALTDIDTALRIDPESALGYSLLLRATHAVVNNQQRYQEYLNKAINARPDSVLVARTAVELEGPQHGGTESAMRNMASQILAIGGVDKNAGLDAHIEWLMAQQNYQRRQYSQAVTRMNRALQTVQSADLYRMRGNSRLALQQYPSAMEDMTRAIALRSADGASYLGRAKAYGALRQYRNAAAELTSANELMGDAPELLMYRQSLIETLAGMSNRALQRREFNQALDFTDKALMLDKNSGTALYQRAQVWLEMGELAEAENDAVVAVKQPEAQFEWFELLDTIYSRRQQWQRIEGIWTDYLARYGDEADALLERADARYRRDDFNGALADASKAANMGSTAAGNMINRARAANY